MIYTLAMKYGGQTAISFDGQTQEQVQANLTSCEYTDIQFVDADTYNAFVAAHQRSL